MYGFLQNDFSFHSAEEYKYAEYFTRLQEIQRKLTEQGKAHLVNISGQYRSRKYWGYAMNKYSLNKELQKLNAEEIKQINDEKEKLFEAYEIIQKMREAITGQSLTYRLYATDPKNGNQLGFITVKSSEELKQFINFSDKELAISQSKVLSEIKKANESSKELKATSTLYQRIINEKMTKVNVDSIKMDYKGTFYQFNKDVSSFTRKYTRGHIIEEIDKMVFSGSTSNIYSAENVDSFINTNLQNFNHITIDSVLGFKGGDNEMVQIKANSARLMRYTSIMYTIDQVLEIGYQIDQGYALDQKDRVVEQLHQIFSDRRGKNEGNRIKQEAIDSFVSDFEKIWE